MELAPARTLSQNPKWRNRGCEINVMTQLLISCNIILIPKLHSCCCGVLRLGRLGASTPCQIPIYRDYIYA